MFLSAASHSTFVLDGEAVLWGFGLNVDGQLGLGHREETPTPAIVPWPSERASVLSVVAGSRHAVLLDADGAVWVAGNALYGRPPLLTFQAMEGLPSIKLVACGHQHTMALDESGKLWSFGTSNEHSQMGWTGSPVEAPRSIAKLPPIRLVACGGQFTVAEAEDGGLWVSGRNNFGQLGLGDITGRIRPIRVPDFGLPDGPLLALAAGEAFSVLLDSQGRAWSCGNNEIGQLGRTEGDTTLFHLIEGVTDLVSLAVGSSQVMAQDIDGQLWGWGYSCFEASPISYDQRQTPNKSGSVGLWHTVAAGHDHSAFSDENGALVLRGRNRFGQLGNGELGESRSDTKSSLTLAGVFRSKAKSARRE